MSGASEGTDGTLDRTDDRPPKPRVDRNGLEILSREESLRLVGTTRLGRVAVVVGGLPVVLPVNFALMGEDVVFRTATGTKLLAAISRSPVSFEVDAGDVPTSLGWSVLITGVASEITRPDERAAADGLGVETWVDERHRYVRIRADVVSGRRLKARGAG